MAARKGETREEYRRRHAAEARERYAANPEKYRKIARDRRADGKVDYRRYFLKYTYGVTPEQVDRMEIQQGGVCAICEGPPSGPGQRLHVDHDHVSGAVRGLLCSKCNTAIGLMADDPARIQAVLNYVTKWREL